MEHGGRRPDRLRLRGLRFVGAHGVYPHERVEGRRFKVDLTLELAPHRAGVTDALDDALDYTEAVALVRSVVTGRSFALIEAMAESIAEALLGAFALSAVEVCVSKHVPGLWGDPDWLSYEIRRERGEGA